MTKGITISSTTDGMESVIAAIEAAQKNIESDIQAEEDASYSYEIGDINTLFTDAQKVCADSIALYTRVFQYQKMIIDGLDLIIKKAAKLAPPAEPSAEQCH